MIGIVEYGAGNTASVINALKTLGVEYLLSSQNDKLDECDKIIFPGVGEASSAMLRLKENKLDEYLKITNKPLLGICLGMQLLSNKSEEGNTECLGIINSNCLKFDAKEVKIPHMGWSEVFHEQAELLFKDIKDGEYFYFANSYYLPVTTASMAKCDYNGVFSAAVKKNNFYGVQFHPEKSGDAGLQLLKNYVELC